MITPTGRQISPNFHHFYCSRLKRHFLANYCAGQTRPLAIVKSELQAGHNTVSANSEHASLTSGRASRSKMAPRPARELDGRGDHLALMRLRHLSGRSELDREACLWRPKFGQGLWPQAACPAAPLSGGLDRRAVTRGAAAEFTTAYLKLRQQQLNSTQSALILILFSSKFYYFPAPEPAMLLLAHTNQFIFIDETAGRRVLIGARRDQTSSPYEGLRVHY